MNDDNSAQGTPAFIDAEIAALETELAGLVASYAVEARAPESATFRLTTLEGVTHTVVLDKTGFAVDGAPPGGHESLMALLFHLSPQAQAAFHAQLIAKLGPLAALAQ